MVEKTADIALIGTKLHRRRHRPLTLVSAPAGYGKSTLQSVFKIRFSAFVQQGLAMLNIVRILPVLLLWAAVASVSFSNVEVVCAQKSALEPVTIQLRWFHQFQFAGYYTAIEKGFYAEEGLQVSLREFEPGKDRIAPILEGKAQYGVGGPSLLKIRAEGHPVVVLAQIFQRSPGVLVTLKESGIFSPYELVNKKMMMPLDDIGNAPIQAMILVTLGDMNRITVVPHTYDNLDLINGKVEAMSAYLSNEPFRLKQQGMAVNIIDPHSYGIDFYGDNLFTTEKEIKVHPERVKKMIRATLKGWEYALEHRDEIIDLILTKYNPDLDRDQLRYEAKVIDQMIVPDLVAIGDINPRRYERIAETYHRLGMLKKAEIPDGLLHGPKEYAIDLTPEEQVWLAEHPVIVLGIPTTYPPVVIKTSNNTYVGMAVDLFEEISQRLNTRIRLHIEDSWSDIQEKAKNREIDGLALGGKHSSRAALYNATDLVLPTYRSVFARSQNEYQLKKFSDLDGMRIGYKRAGRPTRALLEKLPSAILKPYDDHESMTQALLSKEIDVIVAWMSYDYWRKQKLQGTIDNILLIVEYPVDFFTHIRKDWPELIPILNKTIAALQQGHLPGIINKWFGQWPRLSKAASVPLTPEEQAWLKQDHTIRVRVTDHLPYLYAKDGKPVGIAVDLINAVSERTGIKFHFVMPSPPFSADLKGLIQHKGPDLIASLMSTPEREKNILFTKPYISTPRFIFTRDDAEFVSSMENLSGKTVAVIKDYDVHTVLAKNYPDINLLICKNNEDALKAISSGKAFAFIGGLIATPAMINEFGLKNLKAVAPSSLLDHSIAMGIRNDWPELRNIINRAIAAIPYEEKAAIINKWSTVKFEHGIRPADVLKWILVVVGAASGILFLFVFWNRSLKKQVQARTGELNRSKESLEAEISEHKNAQDEIRRSRDYLKNLTDSMGDVVFSVKMPERKIEWVNYSCSNILGYDPEELIGRTTEILYPNRNEFLTFGDKLTGAVAEGKDIAQITQFLRRKSGEAFPVEFTLTIHKEKGEVASTTVIIRDITERKLAEEALQKSEKRFRDISDNASEWIWEVDSNGKYTYASPVVERVLGYKPEEILEKHFYDLFYPDDKEELKRAAFQAFAKKEGFREFINRNVHKNGKVVWLSTSGIPIIGERGELAGYRGADIDITERKLAEEALSKNETRFRGVFESKMIGNLFWDADGSITDANDAFLKMVGYPRDEVLSGAVRWPDMTPPEFKEQDDKALQEIIDTGVMTPIEKEYIRKDGTRISVLLGAASLPGPTIGGIAFVIDITEQKQAEQQLQAYQQRLKALASQLTITEEKERRRIAADLHDHVGQSLALARMQLASARKSASESKLAEMLDEISDTLLKTLEDTQVLMLELSSPLMNEIGLSAAISGWLEEQIGNRHGLKTEFIDNIPDNRRKTLDSNVRAILFRNVRELLVNVVKHARANKVSVRIEDRSSSIRIIVEDDGIGFEPRAMIQAGSKIGGFGLFSIEELMADLGGNLKIVSEPGKGCTAIMSVPIEKGME